MRSVPPALPTVLFYSLVLRFTLQSAMAADDDSAVACPCKIAPVPDLQKKELTARWMVHSLNWGVLTTISSRLDGNDAGPIPFGNVYSFVDGPCNNSTGTPYFYGTYMDQSFQDTLHNTNAALTLSEASLSSVCVDSAAPKGDTIVQRQACQIGSKYGDPENPVCARLTLTGRFVEVTDPIERTWALDAIFARHQSMTNWPPNHNWAVGKLELSDLWLIDFFGGASILDLDAYFAANEFMRSILDNPDEEDEKH